MNTMRKRSGGVIWVTGFSAAGKTTVGRQIEMRLRSLGEATVFLDGDQLRSIFGDHWGYDRDSRVELARVYFRLCSHLASQGLTVILSAVAMYDEVRRWVRTNIPSAIEVYLRVPEDERRKRDKGTKGVYERLGNLAELYDEPATPDLVLDNYGDATPSDAAQRVVEFYQARDTRPRGDYGRQNHWASFYHSVKGPFEPSDFAKTVARDLVGRHDILEIGCGNGRDAVFLAESHGVVALDTSAVAIELCRRRDQASPVHFMNVPVSAIVRDFLGRFDVVYSRFCLHAMTEEEEIEMLSAARRVLRDNGKLYIECRSINDPLALRGEVISPTERICGHYRRFIVLDQLVERVKCAGFEPALTQESKGLAVFGEEDPVVIRLVARKT